MADVNGFAEASQMLNNALNELDELLQNRATSPLQLRRRSKAHSDLGLSRDSPATPTNQTPRDSNANSLNNNPPNATNRLSGAHSTNQSHHVVGGSQTGSDATISKMDPEVARINAHHNRSPQQKEWNGNSWADDARGSGASSGVESPPSDMPASSMDSNLSNIYDRFIKAIERHEIHDQPDLRTKLRIMRWMNGHQEVGNEIKLGFADVDGSIWMSHKRMHALVARFANICIWSVIAWINYRTP
ncbi:unnamed protein product, partial [Mesorhabditis belari]|uniref:Uncharacterized protein n=1 Tax=Mesorhabditis belari TaxID=2138241 RepID=A0AAF3EIW5_9BILA